MPRVMKGGVQSGSDSYSEGVFQLISPTERSLHRDLVLRNIDFIIDILAGEQQIHQASYPCGCPTATPANLAHKRRNGEKFPCIYSKIDPDEAAPTQGCECGDPLAGSDDPLDAVAAVVLASDEQSIPDLYFDNEWRSIVARIRQREGSWTSIAGLSKSDLHDVLSKCSNRNGIQTHRVDRLHQLLQNIEDHHWVDDVTLSGLPSIQYSHVQEFLASQPGISDKAGWWLLLTAFDKPVWPREKETDRLLAELGLLPPSEIGDNSERLTSLEDELTDRQIPALHRALAAHVVREGATFASEDCELRKFSLLYRLEKQRQASQGPTIVDFFAGAGGLSHGFCSHGSEIALAVDNDQDAIDTYRLNHPQVPHEKVLCQDAGQILQNTELLEELRRSVDVVVGGPPCQALSQAGYRARLANDDDYSILDDPRTELYKEYVEAIQTIEPDALVLENVEGMINEVGDSEIKVVDQIIDALEDAGYSCVSDVVDCSEYGIPQTRKRVVILGVDSDKVAGKEEVEELFDALEAKQLYKKYSLRQGLAGLPKIKRGEGGRVYAGRLSGKPSEYVRTNELAEGTKLSFNHQAREHPMEKDQKLFDEVMEPGDTGWSVKYEKGYPELIDYDVGTRSNPAFKDKYRMLDWEDPAPTVVAHLAKDANNFVIPDFYEYVREDSNKAHKARNRGVTPREAARLQSFPDDYIFLGTFTNQFRQIGNAVPPLLGEKLAEVLDENVEFANSGVSAEEISTADLRTAKSDD